MSIFHMTKYRCGLCGKTVDRNSTKAWIKSTCASMEYKEARLYKVKPMTKKKKKEIKIMWKGDLDDDCSARVGNLSAHCECLDKYDRHFDTWYCSVAPVDKAGFVNGPDLFHSSEQAGVILSGTMARAICEAIIKAALR